MCGSLCCCPQAAAGVLKVWDAAWPRSHNKKGEISKKEKANHSWSSALVTAIGWAGLCATAHSTAAAADSNFGFTGSPVVLQVRGISAQKLMAALSLVKKPNALKPGPSLPHAYPAANPDSQICSSSWELESAFWKVKPSRRRTLTRLSKRTTRPFICTAVLSPAKSTYSVCLFTSPSLYLFKTLK